MTDPCLTCPLPDCNERDPRCQNEEAKRLALLRVAQKKRQWQRYVERRARKANEEASAS